MIQGKSIIEINKVIEQVEKALVPGCEIGARDRETLRALLKASSPEKKTKFFACRRENSNDVVTHFVKTKGLAKSKFSLQSQPYIFIVY
jgi:hypothetical protein